VTSERPAPVTTAVVVAVGDELLSGAGVNRNAAWLGTRLGELGVEVVRGFVVGDDVDVITSTLREAARLADLVVVTGGLGPTADDRTRDALAALLGGALTHDEHVEEWIRDWYAERGREVTDRVLVQAQVPTGATALRNPVGTAPGLQAEVGNALVVCVPGVPAEMRGILEDHVLPEVARRSAGPVAIAVLRTTLTPESVVAAMLADIEAAATADGVRVAYLPSPAQVAVRFVAPPGVGGSSDAPTTAPAEQRLAPYVDAAVAVLGDLVAVHGPGTLADEVVLTARRAGATVAVAESLTGGSVLAALTEGAGASKAVLGGVVAYATDLKAALLDVDPDLLAREGAVHPEVAAQMATGVRARSGATYGAAVTGVAGPDPQDGRPPGVVHVAVAGPDGVIVHSPVLRGDRERIRVQAVVHTLELLRRALLGLAPPPA
jgi:nicotinamide-nucleotide amidase